LHLVQARSAKKQRELRSAPEIAAFQAKSNQVYEPADRNMRRPPVATRDASNSEALGNTRGVVDCGAPPVHPTDR